MTTMKEQFDKFYDANPQIADIFLRFTYQLADCGIVNIRADEVLHRVRWEILTTGGNCDGLKTVYGNRYAMELIISDVVSKDFFDLTVAHDH